MSDMPDELKILVVDDEEEFSADVHQDIQEAIPRASVAHVDVESLKTALRVLHERQGAARARREAPSTPCSLDEIDIVVIDFDLANLPATTLANGEMLAYLARCYSACGLIVELNRFGDKLFDLTLTNGAMSTSFADLYVGRQHIANPYLWSSEHGSGLAAWSWPSLPEAVTALRRRTDWICERLDAPLDQTLGDLFKLVMPREIVTELGSQADWTWRKWAGSRTCLQRKDANAVLTDMALARIAAARISHWLERVVLPTQDLLVDAPHLVGRYPGLLESPDDKDTWDSTCRRDVSPRMNTAALRSCVMPDWQLWLSRPAWLWPLLRELAMDQAWEPLPDDAADLAFCEDISRFCHPDEATTFDCGLRTPFARRYIRRIPGVDYQPNVRLLSGHA